MAVSLFQMRWDKVEGSGVANSVLAGTPTGVPPKQILIEIALGDEQVPNLGIVLAGAHDGDPDPRADARPRRGGSPSSRARWRAAARW